MNFQEALTAMQDGKRVTRTCWKDRSKYCFIYQPASIKMLEINVSDVMETGVKDSDKKLVFHYFLPLYSGGIKALGTLIPISFA